MADLVLSAAQTLLAALQCSQLQELCSFWGYKSELKDLKVTVSTIQKVLLDAEAKQELSFEEEDYIEKLKDAVYDADDLFDEVRTLAELKQLSKDSKLSRKVRDFFSSKNPLSVAYTTSKEVKKIRKKLEAIAHDHRNYHFKVDSHSIRKRREDTCSYVFKTDVIGRAKDAKAVIDMLLDPSVAENVGFVTIVGVGGMGKTTLAQLVYNDEKVVAEFDLKLWVCVSDQERKEFDVRAILAKILELAIKKKPYEGSAMESIQTQLQETLSRKKYLIVLDDLWNENHLKWLSLVSYLMVGGRGSRIVVTTRSELTAESIKNGRTYKLEGLSPESSWDLFEMTAFDRSCEHASQDLVEIGKKIVGKCSNVPLVLKVLGSLLYGQGKSKWEAFEKSGLAQIRNVDKDIMSVLKLSYRSLEYPLKSCFKYCAVFPKDFEIKKATLIRIWMAQGYIVPFDELQSIEQAGEEYFSILLKRCFFQDVEHDKYGEVKTCKIHDSMHDLAQDIAKMELCKSDASVDKLGVHVRHLVHDKIGDTESIFSLSKIRTYVNYGDCSPMGKVIDSWKRLRVLKLRDRNIRDVPDSIGNLMHLRYLDLSKARICALPNSITKLHNMQTLDLSGCFWLEELPYDLSKLRKLRHLDIDGCDSLTSMPPGMDKMGCLRSLTRFVVNEGNNTMSRHLGEMKDLQVLKEVGGRIKIWVKRYSRNSKGEEKGGYLKGMEHLKVVNLYFRKCDSEKGDQEALLEKLQPHSNVKGLSLCFYEGRTIPRWGRSVDNWANLLRGLVKIKFVDCKCLLKLPLLSELPHLKSLKISSSCQSNYIENTSSSSYGIATGSESSTTAGKAFFPSLESLELACLYWLKGWFAQEEPVYNRGISSNNSNKWQPCFPRLSVLRIFECPKLASFPPCPSLETLQIIKCDEALRITIGGRKDDDMGTVSSPPSSSSSTSTCDDKSIESALQSSKSAKYQDAKLREVKIDNLNYLSSAPAGSLSSITFECARKMETTSEAAEVFKSCSSSLRSLMFIYCTKLRNLSRGLEHLTVLESLIIKCAPELIFSEEDDSGEGMPWRCPNNSLRSLYLWDVRKPRNLPRGFQHLTNLKHLSIDEWVELECLPEWISCLSSLNSLRIGFCTKLKSLPKAMQNLTSLHRLEIDRCSKELKERCQKHPQGKDWPNIKHIPHIFIGD